MRIDMVILVNEVQQFPIRINSKKFSRTNISMKQAKTNDKENYKDCKRKDALLHTKYLQ